MRRAWAPPTGAGPGLVAPRVVSVGGTLVAVARTAAAPTDRIWFSVLQEPDEATVDAHPGGTWSTWQVHALPGAAPARPANVRRAASRRPVQLRVAGMGLLTVDPDVAAVTPADADPVVVADGAGLVVLRASDHGSLYLDRLVLRSRQVDASAGRSAREHTLEQAVEARFQRSGNQALPDGETDSVSAVDLLGRPFAAPTVELMDVGAGGGFDAVRVPRGDGTSSWLVAWTSGGAVHRFAFTQTSEELVDLSQQHRSYTPLRPVCAGRDLVPTTAPSLVAYGELDPTTAHDRTLELPRTGRAVLALGVRPAALDGPPLPPAMLVVDCALDASGMPPDLPVAAQGAVLVDGVWTASGFQPDTVSPRFPTPDQEPEVVRLVDGLEVASTVLGQVVPATDPMLRADEDGRVRLYLGTPPPAHVPAWGSLVPGMPQAQLAEYDARVSRVVVELPWAYADPAQGPSGDVVLQSRLSGPLADGTRATVRATVEAGAAVPGLCDVHVEYGPRTGFGHETWRGVPREVARFVQVLSGESSADTGAPDVASGRRPFYDIGAARPQARLPLRGPSGELPPDDPALTLVSARAALPMVGCEVRAAGAARALDVVFRTRDGVDVRCVWEGLPADVASWPAVVDGSAAGVGGAVRGAGSTAVLGLATDAFGVQAPVLLLPAEPSTDLRDVTARVVPSGVDGAQVVLELRQGEVTVRTGPVPSAVEDFAAALLAEPGVRALGVVPDAVGAAGHVVATQGDVGPLGPPDWGALVDVVPPAPGGVLEVAAGPCPVGRWGRTARATPPPGGDADAPRLYGVAVVADAPQSGRTALVADHVPEGAHAPRANRRIGPAAGTGWRDALHLPGGPRSGLAPDRVDGPAHGGAWVRTAPARAATFDGTDALEVPIVVDGHPTPHADNLDAADEWTFEAWLRGEGGGPRRIVTHRAARTPADDASPTGDYWVDTRETHVAVFGAYEHEAGRADASALVTGAPGRAPYLQGEAFTVEMWVAPDEVPVPAAAGLGVLVEVVDHSRGRRPLCLALRPDRRLVLETRDGAGARTTLLSPEPLGGPRAGAPYWSHVAVTGEQGATGWTLRMYVGGQEVASVVGPGPQVGDALDVVSIGSRGDRDVSAQARMAEVRLWSRARQPVDLVRTALVALTGAEACLVGAWPLQRFEQDRGQTVVRDVVVGAARTSDAVLHRARQPLDLGGDDFFLTVAAGVGGAEPALALARMPAGRWSHLAVTHRAGGAVDLNPPERYAQGVVDWAQVEGGDDLLSGPAFAVDAWVRVDELAGPAAVLSRWSWTPDPDGQAVQVGIDEDGAPVLTVVLETAEGRHDVAVHGTVAVDDGALHHLAWTFELRDRDEDQEVEVRLWCDDAPAREPYVERLAGRGRAVRQCSTPLLMGRGAAAPADADQAVEDAALLRGLLGRLRVWSTVPAQALLFDERYRHRPVLGLPPGLVARWEFTEGRGLRAVDGVGGAGAALTSDDLWRGLRATSTVGFVVNGRPVGAQAPAGAEVILPAAPTHRFGAPATAPGLRGELLAPMVWSVVRPPGRVALDMFTPRSGDEPDLLAGWDMGAGGDDVTGGGNAVLPPVPPDRLVASSAPLGAAAPGLRDVYGGPVTDWDTSVPGRAAVGSVVLARDVGTPAQAAVVVRHTLLDPSSLTVPDAIATGEQDLVFVTQVQTSPTLVGLVEGAPPLPSENLTRPFHLSQASGLWTAYAGTSAVTLVQEAGSSVRFTSTSRAVTDVTANLAIGLFGINYREDWAIALVNVQKYQLKVTGQLTGSFRTQLGRREVEAATGTWVRGQRDTFAASGDWEPYQEDGERYLVPSLGRRWVPQNLGMALVESLTADVFATVHRATGVATGTIVVPNPAIPPDRNVITFPIRPTSTKAGTLDGKVGFANDPDWPEADVRRGSYFRPGEAYALADRIDRENERRRAWDFGAVDRGRSGRSALEVEQGLPVRFGEDADDHLLPGEPQVGLVNRYVWHADQGLHVESQSIAAGTTSTFTGWRDIGGSAGVKVAGEFFFYLGFAFSFDMSAGHTVGVEVTGETGRTRSVSLDVQVNGERYLRAWSPTAPAEHGTGTGAYLPGPAPGKVRAYRFMTFYLPPRMVAATAFAQVVDPAWLALSGDPAARALRDARTDGPVWRVLHRVTYVERVPPVVASTVVRADAGRPLPTAHAAGSAWLVDLVRERIGQADPSRDTVGAAVAQVMAPAPDHGAYPRAVLEDLVPWWTPLLAQARLDAHGAAGRTLRRLVDDVVRYVTAGYAAGEAGEG